MAQLELWNISKNRIMEAIGALPKEEVNSTREYKATHEENFFSSWLMEEEVKERETSDKAEEVKSETREVGEGRERIEIDGLQVCFGFLFGPIPAGRRCQGCLASGEWRLVSDGELADCVCFCCWL